MKDYTGRTPEAQSQTLVITHLNKDRRALNSLIHDARRENGKPAKKITLPVLVTSNIRDGELRKLSTGRLTRRRWRWLITYTTVSAKWIRIIS
uniref:Multifunctional conjugation protein TraI n=1 Tax=Klebsiella pneumoniae TaxID=573 RepID=A0A2P1BP35_KLEPN|nr:Multifunctional conjugation protein TraI [Klebsiella pneumoniae]